MVFKPSLSETSILWNSLLSERCHQIRAETEKTGGGMLQEMWPMGRMDGYLEDVARPRACRSPQFLGPNGACPDNIILLSDIPQVASELSETTTSVGR
jgi:hypothetical protein